MIKLNLHQFGGHGSGDGSIGADQHGSFKTNKQDYHGSAGGRATMQGGEPKTKSTKSETSTKSALNTNTRQINPNETYNMYSERNGKLTFLSTIIGRQLLSSGYTYDKREETWRDKNRKRIILRTAKKK